ncbi:MAG TPA: citramalate synthase [Humisphaera sp.]
MSRIEIYDTTLRDGTQGEGFNLSLQDKLLIAQKLDELGVDYVEGGFPLSNPKDAAFFRDVRQLKLKHAKVAAFGMTRRRGVKAEDDPGMKSLLEAETPVVTIVGKTSPFQVTNVLGVTLDENVSMIGDSVKLMRSAGRQVVYDAEHFFDTYRSDPAYAMRTLLAAQEAGANVLCLCDTNGGTMPEQVAEAVAAVVKNTSVKVGVHTHNDCGLALANAIAGIRAGATHSQGTINGVGERCGNMDLLPLIANLRLKYKLDCLQGADTLKHLTETSRYVYEIANLSPQNGQPYVGASAFAHKGGMHVHAVQKDASTYEHVSPETVGNERKVLVSEMSGRSNITAKAGKKFDVAAHKEAVGRVLNRVQDLENEGYQFEAAEGSFELLLRKEIGRYRRFFDLDHYRCVILKQDGGQPVSEATVKLHVGGALEHQVAEGDGPVNSLDAALRKALRPHYPQIDGVHLTDYKVRVINSKDETAAKVRVVIECKRERSPGEPAADGQKELFGTIGVSTNVIDASWQALVDAYEYHLVHAEEAKG